MLGWFLMASVMFMKLLESGVLCLLYVQFCRRLLLSCHPVAARLHEVTVRVCIHLVRLYGMLRRVPASKRSAFLCMSSPLKGESLLSRRRSVA